MTLELDFDFDDCDSEKADGQVNIKLPKDFELKFRLYNVKYNKKLSKVMRKVAIKLIEQLDQKEAS